MMILLRGNFFSVFALLTLLGCTNSIHENEKNLCFHSSGKLLFQDMLSIYHNYDDVWIGNEEAKVVRNEYIEYQYQLLMRVKGVHCVNGDIVFNQTKIPQEHLNNSEKIELWKKIMTPHTNLFFIFLPSIDKNKKLLIVPFDTKEAEIIFEYLQKNGWCDEKF